MSENNLEINQKTIAETFVTAQCPREKNITHFLAPVPSGKQRDFVKGPIFWKKQCTQGKRRP